MSNFDIFTIRQWQEGYTLQVNIARPRNAPRFKSTHADRKRRQIVAKMNYEVLSKKTFTTLDEVFSEIKKLQFPSE